jgi:hypothetical protein
VCKIDNQPTPAQLSQLKDGLAITEAMQELRAKTNSGGQAAGQSIRAITYWPFADGAIIMAA